MAYTKKIEIQALSQTLDEIGQPIREWRTIFRPWAEVNCTGGREYYAAAQVNSGNDMIFKVRYSRKIADCLTSEIRIIYCGKVYDIKHIDDFQERHLQLVFRTEQRNGGVNEQ